MSAVMVTTEEGVVHVLVCDNTLSLLSQMQDPAPDMVIGADTVVTKDDRIFEKPCSKQDAFDMLSG